jgi:coatomer subunit alpha
LDHSARPRTISIDPTEYRFKLVLLHNNYEEMLHIIKTSNLVGQSIVSYLQQKAFPEVSTNFTVPPYRIEFYCNTKIMLHFVQDKNMCFDLAVECGNLDVALETTTMID